MANSGVNALLIYEDDMAIFKISLKGFLNQSSGIDLIHKYGRVVIGDESSGRLVILKTSNNYEFAEKISFSAEKKGPRKKFKKKMSVSSISSESFLEDIKPTKTVIQKPSTYSKSLPAEDFEIDWNEKIAYSSGWSSSDHEEDDDEEKKVEVIKVGEGDDQKFVRVVKGKKFKIHLRRKKAPFSAKIVDKETVSELEASPKRKKAQGVSKELRDLYNQAHSTIYRSNK
jgi:hypothetical protein